MGIDQGNRYEHEVALARSEFYLGGALSGLHWKKVPHNKRPARGNEWGAATQKGRRASGSAGKEEHWRGFHESR